MKAFLEPFGEPLEGLDPEGLHITAACQAARACVDRKDFRLLELRRDSTAETVVVECEIHVFPKNPVGIQFREPLALQFYRDHGKRMPAAYAVRPDFPVLLHQYLPEHGKPKWLCLYEPPWSHVRRTWTPERFLDRVKWWLEQSAEGTLHAADQPPEQLYFESSTIIVLPPDFDERAKDPQLALEIDGRADPQASPAIGVARFRSLNAHPSANDKNWAIAAVTVGEIAHAAPELPPRTLGELHDRLSARGAPLDEMLFGEIRRLATGASIPDAHNQSTLLLITVPVRAGPSQVRIERRAFLAEVGLGQLGAMAGVLLKNPEGNAYSAAVTLNGLQLDTHWRALKIGQLEVRESFTPERARTYAGVSAPGPSGVIAGVGALGGAIAAIWQREGWGSWTYVDPDVVQPHNLARQPVFELHVGRPKVKALRQLDQLVYPQRETSPVIVAAANDFSAEDVLTALTKAEVIVDVSTKIDVPREFAMRNDVGRSLSVFVTPSGGDSVLLLEDRERTIRLDALEAQYYRAVMNAPWGETHLRLASGRVRVGTGCRDLSFVMSVGHVQLHAAILSRQIRAGVGEASARIQVWRSNVETGEVSTTAFPAYAPIHASLGDFRIVWDEGLRAKVRQLREGRLPNETGGVLLGYFDLPTGKVYVVDALPAPPDSVSSSTEFGRGSEGLARQVDEIGMRTAGMVTYVGEWHSHPPGVEANASGKDVRLLVHLAEMLRQDGLPGLMLIVGESTEAWLAGEVQS